MNESNVTHFLGAFAFGIFAKQILPPTIAFVVVMLGGIALECWQYRRTLTHDTAYWQDTIVDLVMDAIGAAAACYGVWR